MAVVICACKQVAPLQACLVILLKKIKYHFTALCWYDTRQKGLEKIIVGNDVIGKDGN
jgi:hypothetical protein